MLDINIIDEYMKAINKINSLSSPYIVDATSSENYRKILQDSFGQIKELAKKNNETISLYMRPILSGQVSLTHKELWELADYFSNFVSGTYIENIDLQIVYEHITFLVDEAKKTNDIPLQIVSMDTLVVVCYMLIIQRKRVFPTFNYFSKYRDIGIATVKEILEYLDKDKFKELDDRCKEIVLINSRYIYALYDFEDLEDKSKVNSTIIDYLEKSYELKNDSFYRENCPSYNWENHEFRVLQYLVDFCDSDNHRELNDEQLNKIYNWTNVFIKFVEDHPQFEIHCPQVEQIYLVHLNGYLTKRISEEAYIEKLKELYASLNKKDYSPRGCYMNFTIPLDLLKLFDESKLNDEDIDYINGIYSNILKYTYEMPKNGALSFLFTLITEILKNFIEIPRGMTFEELYLNLLAASHPPTYVHALGVARLTEYITSILFNKKPEIFIGTLNTKNLEEVFEKKEEIINLSYHSGLLHDIGKLYIFEVIKTYGRNLTPPELTSIKLHPKLGYALLKKHKSTSLYAESAGGHHKFYDNTRGYPEEFDYTEANNPLIINILTIADSLDAATDAIGRSYKAERTLKEYIEEINEESGTRYSPIVIDLLKDDEVLENIEKIITKERDKNYLNIYNLLKSISK